MHINYGETTIPVKVAKVEECYGVKYICDACLRTRDGYWSESPAQIYYQPNPDTSKGHSHYLGVFIRNGKVYLTNGESAFSEPITACVADDGEVIFSRFRHDYRVSKDGTAMIDGGRDYTRSYHPATYVKLKINADKLEVDAQ